VNLITELNALQESRGHLDLDDLQALARRLGVPLSALEAVSSYYPHFRRTPPPPVRVALCRDLSCKMRGAEASAPRLEALCAVRTDCSFERVSCLGRCDRAPACTVNELPCHADEAEAHLRDSEHSLAPAPPPEQRRWLTDPYTRASEHYGVLRAALAADHWGSEEGGVIATIEASGLRGMGGAGFSTGVKWRLIREEPEATK
jgi:NADH:ubiquinone oxidoreductase subunit E